PQALAEAREFPTNHDEVTHMTDQVTQTASTQSPAQAPYRQPAFHPLPSFYGKKLPTVRLEAELYDCELEGVVPPELNGTYYRLGPDTLYPVLGDDDNIINGDGYVMKFRIEDGHVDFASKYVQTTRYLEQRKA